MENQDYPNKDKWQAIFRGSIISSTIGKLADYVGHADSRAQGIIVINSILIPVALSGSQNPSFKTGAVVSIIAAILSITFSIISLYPKSYSGKKDNHPNLMHFSQVKEMSEDAYLKLAKEAFADNSKLAEMAALDIYHLSKYVLAPKFFWLKLSYLMFLIGNIIALGIIGFQII